MQTHPSDLLAHPLQVVSGPDEEHAAPAGKGAAVACRRGAVVLCCENAPRVCGPRRAQAVHQVTDQPIPY